MPGCCLCTSGTTYWDDHSAYTLIISHYNGFLLRRWRAGCADGLLLFKSLILRSNTGEDHQMPIQMLCPVYLKYKSVETSEICSVTLITPELTTHRILEEQQRDAVLQQVIQHLTSQNNPNWKQLPLKRYSQLY